MTLEEMKAIGDRARAIEAAQVALKRAEEDMALFQKLSKAGKRWEPWLLLRERDSYKGYPAVEIRIEVPHEVVQQQLGYKIADIRRKIVLLGGMA